MEGPRRAWVGRRSREAGAIDRLGTVEAGTIVSDSDKDEHQHQLSISTSLAQTSC